MDKNFVTMILDSCSRIFDCLILGILWVICCIPVVTVGASCTALYYAYNKAIREDEGHVIRTFFSGFKNNFKQATIAWLIVAAVGAFLYGDISIVSATLETMPLSGALFAFAVTLFVVVLTWAVYVFAYIARFQLDLKTILKNCLFIMGLNMGWSILLLVVTLAAAFACILSVILAFVVVAIYTPIVNRILERVFSKYIDLE